MGLLHRYRQRRRALRKKAELSQAIALRANALTVQYQGLALNQREPGVAKNSPQQIVVSLTSFGKRIHDVYLTVESLFQQSHKADKIVLWLSNEEFNEHNLPAVLKSQRNRGLEIEFVDGDLGPYKKFFYALKKYPDALLITVDDDVLYPIDIIDRLYSAYLQEPEKIHCGRAHRITLDNQGQLRPYKEWRRHSNDAESSLNVFPTGVGGVLYFPGCFDNDIFNQDAFVRLAPNADDIWLKAMSLKQGVECRVFEQRGSWMLHHPSIVGSQEVSLKRKNKKSALGNDQKLKAVFDEYELFSILHNADS